MLVTIEAGRLGNQLFQYAALTSFAGADDHVGFVGFDDLRSSFSGLRGTFLGSTSGLARLAIRYRTRIDRLATATPGIALVCDQTASCRPKRIFRGPIVYCLESYFQSEAAFNTAALEGLRFRSDIFRQASFFVRELHERWPGKSIVFLHIRRGDYVHWPSRSKPAVLPLSWYEAAMARFESSVFIALTDDPPYAEDFVGKRADVVVSKENVGVDLAIMSLCDGGILSASSLSWWGAYFANDRQGRGPFVAPKYWLGHREEQWRRLGREEEQLDSESKIQTSFLDYV